MIHLEAVRFNSAQDRSLWHDIRNETTVRRACRDPRKITVEQHRVWWDASAKTTTRMLSFIMQNGHVVGILRLDHRKTWMEVWLAIKPEYRRQGFATEAVTLTAARAKSFKWPTLGAVINGRSRGALKLFTGTDFVLTREGFVQVTHKPDTGGRR